jgi:hypothetical protein
MQKIYYHCNPKSLWTLYLLGMLSLSDLCVALRGTIDRMMREFNQLPGARHTSWFCFKDFPKTLHLKEFKDLEELMYHLSKRQLEDIDYKTHLDRGFEYLIIVDDIISSFRLTGQLPWIDSVDSQHLYMSHYCQQQVLISKKILFYNVLDKNPLVFEFMIMFNALGLCVNKLYHVHHTLGAVSGHIIKRVDENKMRFPLGIHAMNRTDYAIVLFGGLHDMGLNAVLGWHDVPDLYTLRLLGDNLITFDK